MKKVILFLVILLAISCNQWPLMNKHAPMEFEVKEKVDFDWLLGSWERTNEKEGRQTYEKWSKSNGSHYVGIGLTMEKGDTIWEENINLLKIENHWSFNVLGRNEDVSTNFILSEIGESSFTCTNDLNEFPKKIYYTKVKEGIHAIISGGDMEIIFDFKRVK